MYKARRHEAPESNAKKLSFGKTMKIGKLSSLISESAASSNDVGTVWVGRQLSKQTAKCAKRKARQLVILLEENKINTPLSNINRRDMNNENMEQKMTL